MKAGIAIANQIVKSGTSIGANCEEAQDSFSRKDFLKTINISFLISHFKNGFTLIELLVVIGLFAVLAGLASINLLRPQTQASLDGTVQVLVADIKAQQLKAMAGDSEGQASAQQYGVHLESASYTLFRGSGYGAGDPANFVVDLDNNVQITTTFPSAQIVFARRSGDIAGFVAGSSGITITNTASGDQKTISLNRFGVVNGI